MRYDIVVLSGETFDSHPSLLITFGECMYLVNTPAQVKRSLEESNFKITKIRHTFLTSVEQRFIGGLIEYSFEARDCNTSTTVSGPLGITSKIKDIQKILEIELPVSKIIEDYRDENITVTNIYLSNSVCYAIKFPDNPGRFNPKKAKELGVPVSSYRTLINGESVTLDNGMMVTPQDTINPGIEGETILIVDCTTVEDLEYLPDDLSRYSRIIHMSSNDLIFNDAYVNKFSTYKENYCFVESGIITYMTAYKFFKSFHSSSGLSVTQRRNEHPVFKSILRGDEIRLAPPERAGLYQTALDDIPSEEYELPETQSFAVTFLGTSALKSSRTRNSPGILITTKYGYIILDTGEGTLQQIRRIFGKKADTILKNLLFVWISHMHRDHTPGIYEIAEEQFKITGIPLKLYAGPWMSDLEFVEFHLNTESVLLDHIILNSVPVRHSFDSCGCQIIIDGQYKICYSGDRFAIPGDQFEQFGDCDLLIHEATFRTPEDLGEAQRHSTIETALAVAERMNAKHLVMCHTSRRFDDTHPLLAFDYLTINNDNSNYPIN